MRPSLNPLLYGVRCSLSGEVQEQRFDRPIGLCQCCTPKKPVVLEYRAEHLRPGWVKRDEPSLWRYRALLPISTAPEHYLQGVGGTPNFRDPRLSDKLGLDVFIKGEHSNLSGSFKDRGLSVAILFGTALGARGFCLPTQGNAGVAAALFCARLDLPACRVWMPEGHRGGPYHRRAAWHGADVHFAGKNISQTGAAMRDSYGPAIARGDLVDLSTFFEPGRLEGKKTLGFEINENFGAELPDVIIYPTGGGTGLLGIWKAFGELRRLGEIAQGAKLPRMIAVQTEHCSPLVNAYAQKLRHVSRVDSQGTLADGLDVPAVIMGHALLDVLRESKGHAVAVSEISIKDDFSVLGRLGLTGGYESAATLSALRKLLRQGVISRKERVLLLFTSGAESALAGSPA